MTRKGQQPSAQLLKNVQYCATDALLGRGTTEAIVNTCIHRDGETRTKTQRALDCGKGAAHLGKAIVVDLPKAVVSSVAECYNKATGRSQGSCAKDVGNAITHASSSAKNWTVATATSAYRATADATSHFVRCNNPWATDAVKRQCAADAAREKAEKEVSARVWQQFRNEHHGYAVAYNSTVGLVKNLFSRGQQTAVSGNSNNNNNQANRNGRPAPQAVTTRSVAQKTTAPRKGTASRSRTASPSKHSSAKQGVNGRSPQSSYNRESGASSSSGRVSRSTVRSSVRGTTRAVHRPTPAPRSAPSSKQTGVPKTVQKRATPRPAVGNAGRTTSAARNATATKQPVYNRRK